MAGEERGIADDFFVSQREVGEEVLSDDTIVAALTDVINGGKLKHITNITEVKHIEV